MAHITRNGHSINGSNFFNTLGLLSILLLHILVDAPLGLIQPAKHILSSCDELAPPLIRLLVLILIRSPVLLILQSHLSYLIDIDSLGVAIVHALRRHSRKVLTINILCMQPLDMPRVSRDVLLLQLMSGSADPGHPVLDVIEVRHCLCCVHLQLYLCDKIILYRTSRVTKEVVVRVVVVQARGRRNVGRGGISSGRC